MATNTVNLKLRKPSATVPPPYGDPVDVVADLANNYDAIDAISPISVRAFGAVANGVADDTVAINNACAAAVPGQKVFFPPGNYLTTSDIIAAPGAILESWSGLRTELGVATQVATIRLKSTFAGNAAISVLDKELGAYASDNSSVQIRNINIDCSAKTSGTVDGIRITGKCDGLVLENVSIFKPPNCGVRLIQYTRVDTLTYKTINAVLSRVVVHNSGSDGFSFNGNTDCLIERCYTLGAAGEGFSFTTSCANTRLIGCQSEWSGLNGFRITGSWNTGTGSGGMLLAGCSTDRNNNNGILIDATGTSPINISSPMLRRDGRNGGTGAGGYAGLQVTGATVPVLISSPTVYPGVDDNGSGTSSPERGVSFSGSTYVAVNGGGYLHAATTPWFDSGTNTTVSRGPGIATRTGSTGAPSAITVDQWPRYERAPVDVGYKAWNYDGPLYATAGGGLTSGTIYLVKLDIKQDILASNIVVYVQTAGVTLTAAQNLAGLYSISGGTATQLSVTGDQSGVWTATGRKTMPLGAAQQLIAGTSVYVALLAVGTTPPQFARPANIQNNQFANGELGVSSAYFATNGAGATALPGTFTLSANTVSSTAFFVALS